VLNVWLCGAETIGDRRATLSEAKPGPPRGELSSPRNANHPGEDIPRPWPRYRTAPARCNPGLPSSIWG